MSSFFGDSLNDEPVLTKAQQIMCIGLLSECFEILGKCDHKDHHGYCQTHFLQKDCIVERIKNFLKEYDD